MPSMKPKKGKSYKCNQCSKKYKSPGFLKRHVQYYCTATSDDEDPHSHLQKSGKYYCIFCDTDYMTAKSFNLHYKKCLRTYTSNASQSKQSSSSSNAVKLHVCNVCQKGFSRLGTYKCHLSCHEKEKQTIKSVIRPVSGNSLKLDSATLTGITRPDLSKLPRIPRLSKQNRLHSDHTFSKPPDAEPLTYTERQLPSKQQLETVDDSDLEEPVLKFTLTLDGDDVIFNNDGNPKLLIKDVRHVERVEAQADSTGGLSMPQLEPHEMYEEVSDADDDLTQQLWEDMHITDEENEEPPQAREVSSSREIVSSSEEEDVTVVEEQPADTPVNHSQAEAVVENIQAETVAEKVSSSTNGTLVLSEEEDVVIVKESTANQPIRKKAQVAKKSTSATTITSQRKIISTISLLENKPFVCQICSRKFHTEKTMRQHYKIHQQKSNCVRKRVNTLPKCSIHKEGDPRCHCLTRPLPESSNHRSNQTRLFECLFCGFSSVDQNALLNHKIHFHRKNFACKICKRTFRTRLTRLLHMKTHKSVAQ